MLPHRTYGETKTCKGCRYWSEMIAKVDKRHRVVALCLNSGSSMRNRYTTAAQSCPEWRSGHFGAVDEPPDYGEEARRLYAEEDGIEP